MKLFKKLFGKKEKTKKDVEVIYAQTLSISNYINTIYSIYNNQATDDYERKVNYIKNILKTENERKVLSYINIIMYLKIPKSILLKSLICLITSDMTKKIQVDGDYYQLIISGNLYQYKELFKNTIDQHQKILLSIKEELYQIESIFFKDFISYDIMKKDKFVDYSPKEERIYILEENKNFKVLDFPYVGNIFTSLESLNVKVFSFRDILELLYIVVYNDNNVMVVRYLSIYENEYVLQMMSKLELDLLDSVYNLEGYTKENILDSVYYEKLEEKNKEVDFYEDVDEIVEYR